MPTSELLLQNNHFLLFTFWGVEIWDGGWYLSLIQVEGLEDHSPHSFCFHAARLISQVIVHTAWQLASHRTVFGLWTTQPDPAGRTENSTQENRELAKSVWYRHVNSWKM